MTFENIILPFLIVAIEAIAVLLGGWLVITFKISNRNFIPILLSFAAGNMLFASLVKVIPVSIDLFNNVYEKPISLIYFSAAFFIGVLATAPIDYLFTHILKNKHEQTKNKPQERNKLYFIIFLSITFHNFFEGIAIYLAYLSEKAIIAPLLIAVIAHNIPEGAVIGTMAYKMTKSKGQTLLYSFLCGASGLVGATLTYFILQDMMSSMLLAFIKAILAGLLINTSLAELFTRSLQKGEYRISSRALIGGMIFMSILLIMMEW